jgi:hypothetical protein
MGEPPTKLGNISDGTGSSRIGAVAVFIARPANRRLGATSAARAVVTHKRPTAKGFSRRGSLAAPMPESLCSSNSPFRRRDVRSRFRRAAGDRRDVGKAPR